MGGIVTMESDKDYSETNLEGCSYRFLQQTAKALELPSNVKKVYLIQLIATKKYGSQQEIDALVKQVRQERQQQAMVRKKATCRKKHVQQSAEISSTSNSQSPRITNTPKRASHIFIRYSPEQYSPVKYPRTLPTKTYPLTSSDRVLRSFNRVKKPSYLLNNTLISLIKPFNPEETSETRVNIVSKEKFRKVNRTYTRKRTDDDWRNGMELVPVPRRVNLSSPRPAKRQRRLSGIYPLNPEDIKPNVSVRRADGTICKLNAIIQKSVQLSYDRQFDRNRTLLCIEDRPHTASNISEITQNFKPSNISELAQSLTYKAPNRTDTTNLSVRAPNMTEIAQSLGYRTAEMSDIAPNIDYRAQNITQKTPNLACTAPNITEKAHSLAYRISDISDTTSNSYRRENMSELSSNLGYRVELSEVTPNNGYRAKQMSETTPNYVYRSQQISETTPNYVYRSQQISEAPPNYTFRTPNNIADLPQNSFNFNYTSSFEESNLSNSNNCEEYAVYYHKKIRAEQVRSLRSRETARCVDNECQLPKINEVFSKFNNNVYCRDVTQPIYVQVDSEPDIATSSYIPDPRVQYGDGSLERLYNLKKTYQPLLQIATTTTAKTRTVFCTPVITTALPQPSTSTAHNVYNIASSRDSQPYLTDEEIPRVHDFFRNFRCEDEAIHEAQTEDFRRSSSSIETLTSQEQDLGANVTIPEMVEDALELISQDGDYMERMGMDIRMQCILCQWAGPKIILEYHIRKMHSNEIIQCESSEWCTTYTLGSLSSRRLWLSQVLEYRGTLYVLSAKYEDPDYFMAALSTISTDPDTQKRGSMTIYNKVTGEPFTWQGDVTQLPPCMPYDNDPNCFRLQLARMDLLPNSANLRLLNRELVIRSPTKVVVGQPELDSIHICLMVKIFD